VTEVLSTTRIQRGESALRQARGPELSRGTTARCASTEDHQAPSLPLLREQGINIGVIASLPSASKKGTWPLPILTAQL